MFLAISVLGVVWTPEQFFKTYLSQSSDNQTSQEKKLEANVLLNRNNWFSGRMATLATDVKTLVSKYFKIT